MKRGRILLLAAVGSVLLGIAGADWTATDSSETNGAAALSDCGPPGCPPLGGPARSAPLVPADIGTIFARFPH